MDVVVASPEHWSVPPFSGAIKDGAVWGRGALDMKGEGIAQLMTVLILKRTGAPLKRDVIFLATSDEEVGQGVGAAWFLEQQRALIGDAEFVLNEGGTTRAGERGEVEYVGIGTTEKSPFWLDVTARGTAGHGSRPTPDNPVHRLVRALHRLATYETPLIVTPTVERYFRGLAVAEPDTLRRRWYRDIRAALRDSAAARAITSEVYYNAILRNTITVTGLRGSEQTNVIPSVARATVDVRLLPGQDPDRFLAELMRVVDDEAVSITPQGVNWSATESPTDAEAYRAIVGAVQALRPGVRVVPTMLAGFTDSHYFRRIGISSYGVSPFPLTAAEAQGVHANDERLSVAALTFGVRLYYEIVKRVAVR
jgi:acetylornithine deacetylase/succinyl-diaminopimelate desuccinylase-like protein